MSETDPDPLELMIWQQVAAIPYATLSSYGEIARQCGYPGHARYVGRVLKSLPDDSQLPWHRVVTASGKLAFAEGSQAFLRQKVRLQDEGFVLVGNRVISAESG